MPVDILRRGAAKNFPTRELKRVALKILELLHQENAELSLALVGNAEIRELNARFRHKDSPTDVLSFPVEESPAGLSLLGDVIISVEKAEEQAKERQRTLNEELAMLLIHGALHLLGYDHERSARQARVMRAMEKKLYRALCDEGILRV
ncbi:MAG TPA: rRNA maturation RNase YbeY [Candidatus Binatia bacterium]|nr:rRNA maturation RNase YbeY [Candidatus Binatia bacterium]